MLDEFHHQVEDIHLFVLTQVGLEVVEEHVDADRQFSLLFQALAEVGF